MLRFISEEDLSPQFPWAEVEVAYHFLELSDEWIISSNEPY